jgi:hypothetical protein
MAPVLLRRPRQAPGRVDASSVGGTTPAAAAAALAVARRERRRHRGRRRLVAAAAVCCAGRRARHPPALLRPLGRPRRSLARRRSLGLHVCSGRTTGESTRACRGGRLSKQRSGPAAQARRRHFRAPTCSPGAWGLQVPDQRELGGREGSARGWPNEERASAHLSRSGECWCGSSAAWCDVRARSRRVPGQVLRGGCGERVSL